MRLPVPIGLSDWWDTTLPPGPLRLSLRWSGGASLQVGTLHRDRMLVHFAPDPADLTEGAERLGRLLGKAFTRAGWRRPALDPGAMLRLLDLRRGSERLEFILDTNALVEGIAHWLVDHFADRCDLVITAVTLRELQDANGTAKWGCLPEPKKKKDLSKVLGARQLYLSTHRLRERTGYHRVLWRELEVDDTALLLSRGNGGEKSSESDTLLLRAVRRSIHDRVNNLERFFVTGDTALARRAATELPAGTVVAAQVQELSPNEVVFPCSWWPGPDQGLRVVRHPGRLVWELLCVADEVVLKDEGTREWSFKAFGDPMWPTDYLEPWVEVTVPVRSEAPTEPVQIESGAAGDPPEAPAQEAATHPPDRVWTPDPDTTPAIEDNLRMPARATMELLAALALNPGPDVAVPAAVYETSVSKHHVRLFVETLKLGALNDEASIITPGPAAAALRDAWKAGDLDAVFDQVRGWSALNEWATLDDPPKRPTSTQTAARALAALLGQGTYHPETKKWVCGGRRPGVADMKAAVRAALPTEGQQALSIYRLLVDVFLIGLGVSPARVEQRWSDLWAVGVFEGFEPREGGSSSGNNTQEVAALGSTGWSTRKLDLESLAGVRDLVLKGAA